MVTFIQIVFWIIIIIVAFSFFTKTPEQPLSNKIGEVTKGIFDKIGDVIGSLGGNQDNSTSTPQNSTNQNNTGGNLIQVGKPSTYVDCTNTTSCNTVVGCEGNLCVCNVQNGFCYK